MEGGSPTPHWRHAAGRHAPDSGLHPADAFAAIGFALVALVQAVCPRMLSGIVQLQSTTSADLLAATVSDAAVATWRREWRSASWCRCVCGTLWSSQVRAGMPNI
jgi:hypothetical protein